MTFGTCAPNVMSQTQSLREDIGSLVVEKRVARRKKGVSLLRSIIIILKWKLKTFSLVFNQVLLRTNSRSQIKRQRKTFEAYSRDKSVMDYWAGKAQAVSDFHRIKNVAQHQPLSDFNLPETWYLPSNWHKSVSLNSTALTYLSVRILQSYQFELLSSLCCYQFIYYLSFNFVGQQRHLVSRGLTENQRHVVRFRAHFKTSS